MPGKGWIRLEWLKMDRIAGNGLIKSIGWPYDSFDIRHSKSRFFCAVTFLLIEILRRKMGKRNLKMHKK